MNQRRPQGRPDAAAIGGAVAVLLGLAIAGGSIFAGSGTNASVGEAFPYVMIGALAALALVGVAYAALRSAMPDGLGQLRRWLLPFAAVAVALGGLLGAALTPNSDPEEDQTEQNAGDSPLSDDQLEQRRTQLDGINPSSRASTVDRDGDGAIDRNTQGDPVMAIDIDGDGSADTVLHPCEPMAETPSRPGQIAVDYECDGRIDEWVDLSEQPLDADQLPPPPSRPDGINPDSQAGNIDRNGDGVPDVDADGNPLIALDVDGDGIADTLLTRCTGLASNPSRPGQVPVDYECDGIIDEWFQRSEAPLDSAELGALPELPAAPPVATTVPDADVDAESDDDGGGSIWSWILVALIALVGTLAVVMIVRHLRNRDTDSELDETDDEPDEGPSPPAPLDLGNTMEQTMDAMLEDQDPRKAICAAYGMLLDGLAEQGLPRRPEEAPEEHMQRCLTAASLQTEPVRELLGLFGLARFSTHMITEDHRRAAIRALRASLARPLVGAAGSVATGTSSVPSPPPSPVPFAPPPPPPPPSSPGGRSHG